MHTQVAASPATLAGHIRDRCRASLCYGAIGTRQDLTGGDSGAEHERVAGRHRQTDAMRRRPPTRHGRNQHPPVHVTRWETTSTACRGAKQGRQNDKKKKAQTGRRDGTPQRRRVGSLRKHWNQWLVHCGTPSRGGGASSLGALRGGRHLRGGDAHHLDGEDQVRVACTRRRGQRRGQRSQGCCGNAPGMMPWMPLAP